MWYEIVAPGGGTPIHKHDCEETFLVLSGIGGEMKIQAADGRVISQKLNPMSTITILPNARHQFVNTGDEDVTFVVAFDNAVSLSGGSLAIKVGMQRKKKGFYWRRCRGMLNALLLTLMRVFC
jgi:hypothetical protein